MMNDKKKLSISGKKERKKKGKKRSKKKVARNSDSKKKGEKGEKKKCHRQCCKRLDTTLELQKLLSQVEYNQQ